MALSANTYGTVARVQALVGDIVSGRIFTTGTIPTLAQVEVILDDIASEINVELEGARYTLETAADFATNQPRVSDFLITLNTRGAAAEVLSTLPNQAVAPAIEGDALDRATFYHRRYLSGLKRIREKQLNATRSALRVKAGGATDSLGNTTKPIFTRDLTDFPGTRSLTER